MGIILDFVHRMRVGRLSIFSTFIPSITNKKTSLKCPKNNIQCHTSRHICLNLCFYHLCVNHFNVRMFVYFLCSNNRTKRQRQTKNRIVAGHQQPPTRLIVDGHQLPPIRMMKRNPTVDAPHSLRSFNRKR